MAKRTSHIAPLSTRQGSRPGEERDDVMLLLNEIQLLLAEKRTSLSVLRTAIAILVLPLSVLSVLIATSRFYETSEVLHLLVPVLGLNAGLVVVAGYLLVRAVRRIYQLDALIADKKRRSAAMRSLVQG